MFHSRPFVPLVHSFLLLVNRDEHTPLLSPINRAIATHSFSSEDKLPGNKKKRDSLSVKAQRTNSLCVRLAPPLCVACFFGAKKVLFVLLSSFHFFIKRDYAKFGQFFCLIYVASFPFFCGNIHNRLVRGRLSIDTQILQTGCVFPLVFSASSLSQADLISLSQSWSKITTLQNTTNSSNLSQDHIFNAHYHHLS